MEPKFELSKRKCVPCTKGTPPLQGERLIQLHQKLDQSWKLTEEHHLEKVYMFRDFKEALDFTNQVGNLAESEGHHPDIHLAYGRVKIELWTHKINGLSESDFIMAAKCDALPKN